MCLGLANGIKEPNKITPQEAIDFIENEVQIDVRYCSHEKVDKTKEVFQLAVSALEKQIPKKPISQTEKTYDGDDIDEVFLCSECKMFICHGEELNFCKESYTHCHCGQKIDWSDYE